MRDELVWFDGAAGVCVEADVRFAGGEDVSASGEGTGSYGAGGSDGISWSAGVGGHDAAAREAYACICVMTSASVITRSILSASRARMNELPMEVA